MANNFLAVSDETYTLSESEDKNVFYFYRNDEGVLSDVGRKPMDLFQSYIMQKMTKGEIETDFFMGNICFEKSTDGKCIRLIIEDVSKKVASKKPNFIKRLINKIFG